MTTLPPSPDPPPADERAELTTQLSHVRPAGVPEPGPPLQEDQVRVLPPSSRSRSLPGPASPPLRWSFWGFVLIACVGVGVALGFALAR